jgi:acyl-CoA reductase-like NAD-dependent aldehyde dehydrogenase
MFSFNFSEIQDHFIAGAWLKGLGRQATPALDVYKSEILATFSEANEAQIQLALNSLDSNFQKSPLLERIQILKDFSKLIVEHETLLVDLLVKEAGKPRSYAKSEVARSLAVIEQCLIEAHHFKGEEIRLDYEERGLGRRAYTQYQSKGAVLAISPYNFPLNLVMHKLAPAVIAGSSVILCPSPHTKLITNLLTHLFSLSTKRKSLLQVIHATHAQIQSLVKSSEIKVVSFTGSAQVGWYLKSLDSKKHFILELGGNAPVYIDHSADLNLAAKQVCQGAFLYSGQICISTQRVYIHKNVYQSFKDLVLTFMKGIKSGDPNHEEVINGPLISSAHYERIQTKIKNLKAPKLHSFSEDQKDHNLISPKLIEGLSESDELMKEEIFGPLCLINSVESEEEALCRMNEGQYGLHAGVFTNSLSQFKYFADNLDFGGILFNHVPGFRVDGMPYGGIKESGYGKEGPFYTLREYSDQKIVIF